MSGPSPEKRPRAVLVGVQLPGVDDAEHTASMAELRRLVTTLGMDAVAEVSQRRASPSPDAVVGEGKLREIARWTGGKGKVTLNIPGRKKKDGDDPSDDDDTDDLSAAELAARARAMTQAVEPVPEAERAEFVVFDSELSPTQLRNLQTATGVEVLDRTGVIVEIFHRHAKTREARLQVEIARLRYLAPRLKMQRGPKERSGAGIGAKGVGETAHELDKRRIRDRIAELTHELEQIHKSQEGRRARREEQAKVALVGYTNAGKSSLMRALTGSQVLVEDKLFATLDTTIRVLHPETVPKILVSDTVGFIKKLPHDLVASFRSTLDEARDASLLLFVADASDPTFRSQLAVTKQVTGEIGADVVPSYLVLNKCDRLDAPAKAALRIEFPDAIQLSAHAAADVQALHGRLVAFFEKATEEVELFIPYAAGQEIGEIRRTMRVVGERHDDEGTTLTVRARPEDLKKWSARRR